MIKSRDAIEISSLDIPGLGTVKKGLKVVHPHFGDGMVVGLFVFPDGEHLVGVEFAAVGYKALAPGLAHLRLP